MNSLKKISSLLGLGVLLVGATNANAILLDFGVSWPAYTAPGVGNYAVAPYNSVLGTEDGQHANEDSLAALLNSIAGTSFVGSDITKTDSSGLTQVGSPDGYFTVGSGWNYLIVQYDGPNGGGVVIKLDGNSARLPWDSSLLWGEGNQYGVTHIAVVEPHDDTGNTPVPDGGSTMGLLGLALLGAEYARRRFLKC